MTTTRPAAWRDPKRLAMHVAVAVALVSAVLLFGSEAFLSRLRVEGLRDTHGRALGVALLATAAYVVVGFAFGVAGRVQTTRRLRERLDALDDAERSVLREFALQGRNTIAAPVNDLAVAGLLTAGVLNQVGGLVQPTPHGMVSAVRIDPRARRLLTPDTIRLSSWTPPERERRSLLDLRPPFVGEVARWDALFRL